MAQRFAQLVNVRRSQTGQRAAATQRRIEALARILTEDEMRAARGR